MNDDTRPDERAAAAAEPFLPDYLLFLLASLSAAASADFHAIVRETGLRVQDWRVLACLHDNDGQMATRLAQLALVEQSHLTRIIDQMDARGLVERRSDSKDRRRVRVYLTAEGARLAEIMVEKARRHERAFMARLPGGGDLKRLLKLAHGELGLRP